MDPGWPRSFLFGVDIDAVSMHQAVEWVLETAKLGCRPCRFVVTPNADHAILLQEDDGLLRAYKDASLVVPDGWPVVLASRLLGKPLVERVTGSDLVPAVFEAASPSNPLRVYLLGAAPGVADRAARLAEQAYPGIRVVGAYGPPFGFERDAAENERILEKIREAKPELLLVGVGAPKQELWVHRNRDRIEASVALCIGATIDFLAGEKARAPVVLRRLGLEWLHRALTEPRRLVPRYARNMVHFPKVVLREWWHHGR
ncbi:MAG TPA: WecB/TagA/CpsF family glycosyltransferase [Polyangiaceae bacterium]|nr:WecB/TagA/CpsF family glycosyltransferase [Polyangiaceae bacterium]